MTSQSSPTTHRPRRAMAWLWIAMLLSGMLACRSLAPNPTPTLREARPTHVAPTRLPTATPADVQPPEISPAPILPTELQPKSSPPPATPAPTVPGQETILYPENLSAGDPYAPELGNAGYDAQHYTLALSLDPANLLVDGQMTMAALSTQDGLQQVSLDFVGFEVGAVTVDGIPAHAFRYERKLVVDLPQPVDAGDAFTLVVAYAGEPVREVSRYIPFIPGIGLYYASDGESLFVAAEPDGARYWYPVNDHPRDKAAYRFEITVPDGLTAVANGTLVEQQTELANGRAGDRFVWEHPYPVASAFVTVAVGDYELVETRSPAGRPIRSYVFSSQADDYQDYIDTIGEALDWMSEQFGDYPFDTFGYVMVRNLDASLETQTMVLMDTRMLDEMTFVHEMAHMWFGDWVSLDSWGDIWRSEGFATYVSMLWQTREAPESLDTVMQGFEDATQDVDYPLGNPPAADMFGMASYIKGAVVVHELRLLIGDDAFYQGLRTYFERYGGGSASRAEFQAVMEEASGQSLDEFFQQWLDTASP